MAGPKVLMNFRRCHAYCCGIVANVAVSEPRKQKGWHRACLRQTCALARNTEQVRTTPEQLRAEIVASFVVTVRTDIGTGKPGP